MVIELTDQTFDEVLATEQDKLTVVDFWAPWCGPCKMMGPLVDQLAEEMTDVRFCKVNCDENDDTCSKVEIRNLPTFIFYKNGEIVKKLSGGIPKPKFVEEINSVK